METWGRERGDVQAIAAVLQKNLSNAGRFLKLAELYRDHGNLDKALDWGRQGIEHFGAQGMNPLVDFCIDAHLRRQDSDAAQALAWARFIHAANAHTYGILMAVAKRLDRQAELSKQALGHLTERMVAEEKAPQKPNAWVRGTRSELVDLHLQNKQPDEAWALFVGGNVSRNLWEPMTQMRGKTHLGFIASCFPSRSTPELERADTTKPSRWCWRYRPCPSKWDGAGPLKTSWRDGA